MPLGTTITVRPANLSLGAAETSNSCVWTTIIDAGGPAVQDAAAITNPDTQITASTRHRFDRDNHMGRFIQARLVYDDGITSPVSPILKLFGRSYSDEAWTAKKNRAGAVSGELTIDQTNDAQDGTYGYTTPDSAESTWEISGENEFIFGVETAHSATGTVSTSKIQVRIF